MVCLVGFLKFLGDDVYLGYYVAFCKILGNFRGGWCLFFYILLICYICYILLICCILLIRCGLLIRCVQKWIFQKFWWFPRGWCLFFYIICYICYVLLIRYICYVLLIRCGLLIRYVLRTKLDFAKIWMVSAGMGEVLYGYHSLTSAHLWRKCNIVASLQQCCIPATLLHL